MMKYFQTGGDTWAECFSECFLEWIGSDDDLTHSLYDLEDGTIFSMDGLTCEMKRVNDIPVITTSVH